MYRKIKGGRERKNIERPHNSVKIAVVQLFRLRGGCFVLVWWRDVSLNRNLAGFFEAFTFNQSKAGNLSASCGVGQGNLLVVLRVGPRQNPWFQVMNQTVKGRISTIVRHTYIWQNFIDNVAKLTLGPPVRELTVQTRRWRPFLSSQLSDPIISDP